MLSVSTRDPGFVDAGQSRVSEIITANIVLICVASMSVLVRIYVRAFMLKSFGLDDVLVIASYLLSTVLLALVFQLTKAGLGTHQSDEWHITMASYHKYTIVSGVFYVWGFVTVKLSFVALYHRIFVQKPFKRLNKVLGLVLVCQGIEESLVLIFQCRPVNKAWTPHTAGWCVNLQAFYYASFGVKFITDIVLFLQPFRPIWRLNLARTEKIALSVMLSLGLFVCAISILRMCYLSMDPDDPTYLIPDSTIWSEVEILSLIVCSCIPPLRNIVGKFPRINRALGFSETSFLERRHDEPEQQRGPPPLEMRSIIRTGLTPSTFSTPGMTPEMGGTKTLARSRSPVRISDGPSRPLSQRSPASFSAGMASAPGILLDTPGRRASLIDYFPRHLPNEPNEGTNTARADSLLQRGLEGQDTASRGKPSPAPASGTSSIGTSQATSRRRSNVLVEVPESEKESEEDVIAVPVLPADERSLCQEQEAGGRPIGLDQITDIREPPVYCEPTTQGHLIDEQVETVGGPPPERYDFAFDRPKDDRSAGAEGGDMSPTGEPSTETDRWKLL